MHYQATIKHTDGTSYSSSLYATDALAVQSIMRPHMNPDDRLMVTRITGASVEVAYVTTVRQYNEDTN